MLPRRLLFLIPLFYLLPCSLQAQDQVFTFQALVRIDSGNPTPVELDVPANESRVVAVGAGYQLEITAPAVSTGSVNVLLSREQDGKWLPQYTLRQPLRNAPLPRLGFLVCEGNVRLLQPVPGTFPACRD